MSDKEKMKAAFGKLSDMSDEEFWQKVADIADSPLAHGIKGIFTSQCCDCFAKDLKIRELEAHIARLRGELERSGGTT
jgi:hypothetical protein